MKKLVLFKIIVIVILLVVLITVFFLIKKDNIECKDDKDCFASSCCHSNSCVGIKYKPNCDGIFCTMECEIDTLDCGQKSCGCNNGKCEVSI